MPPSLSKTKAASNAVVFLETKAVFDAAVFVRNAVNSAAIIVIKRRQQRRYLSILNPVNSAAT